MRTPLMRSSSTRTTPAFEPYPTANSSPASDAAEPEPVDVARGSFAAPSACGSFFRTIVETWLSNLLEEGNFRCASSVRSVHHASNICDSRNSVRNWPCLFAASSFV